MKRLLVIVVVGAALAYAVWLTAPPGVVRPVSGSQFSTDAAMGHVRAIATEPRPAGSAANARARAYVGDELRRLGLTVEEQAGAVLRGDGVAYTVRNVVGRLKGTAPGKAILIAGHYDSVSAGPGAADDGAAVGAILETVRVLTAGRPLRRDLIVLLTDGEEMGLLGARLFCDDHTFAGERGAPLGPIAERPGRHRWVDDVGLVLNFEARGTSGPSIMFETGPGNLALLRRYARADPAPVANSLSYDVYLLLRNDSDFSIFRRAGMQGLNFAFIGDYVHYHTRRDTPANLDPRSLAHHGAHAVSLVRELANLDDAALAEVLSTDQPNAVDFDLAPGWLVVYPATWVWPLYAAQVVLIAVAVGVAWRRRLVTWRAVGGTAARVVLSLLVAPAATVGLMALHGRATEPQHLTVQIAAVFALGAVVVFACAWTPAAFWRRGAARPGAVGQMAVIVVVWTVIGALANVYLPGGSYLTTWPVVLVGGAMMVSAVRPGSWGAAAAAAVAGAGVVVLFVPVLVLALVALTLGMAGYVVVAVVLAGWLVGGVMGWGEERAAARAEGDFVR